MQKTLTFANQHTLYVSPTSFTNEITTKIFGHELQWKLFKTMHWPSWK